MSDDIFEYEIDIPETTAKICLSKTSIYEKLERRLGHPLSEVQKKSAWKDFSSHKDFWNVFPGEAMNHGVHMYGASDYQTYSELFETSVQDAIQESIDDTMRVLWANIFQKTLDDVVESLEAKEEEQQQARMAQAANPVVYPTLPSSPPAEADNKYIEFLKEQHPMIKAANPTWTPQQIIVAIGHKWSLDQMTVEKKNDTIRVKQKNGKVNIDACGKPDELKSYLDAYRAKYGNEAFFEFAKKIGKAD